MQAQANDTVLVKYDNDFPKPFHIVAIGDDMVSVKDYEGKSYTVPQNTFWGGMQTHVNAGAKLYLSRPKI